MGPSATLLRQMSIRPYIALAEVQLARSADCPKNASTLQEPEHKEPEHKELESKWLQIRKEPFFFKPIKFFTYLNFVRTNDHKCSLKRKQKTDNTAMDFARTNTMSVICGSKQKSVNARFTRR